MKRFALTAKQVETVKATCGKSQLTDGQGLYLKLFFDRPGHSWRFDYTRPNSGGKRNTLVLGSSDTMSLADARTKAQEARELLAKGIDPAKQRDAARTEQRAVVLADAVAAERAAKKLAPAGTLQGVAEDYHARNVGNKDWTALHAAQWLRTLANHVFPRIGLKPIAEVTPKDVLDCVEVLERAGMDPTSRNVRKYLVQVFDYAMVLEVCKGNPAHAIKSIVKKNVDLGHNPAVTTPDGLRTVLLAIRDWPTPVTREALMVQAALFQRPANTCSMQWPHVDLDAARWVIPAAEMKGKKVRKQKGSDHVVPLPKQVVELLRSLKPLTGRSKYVFESPSNPGLPITNDTLTNALRNMGFGGKQTAHGFRATARTMLVEQLGVQPQYVEAQLAHVGGNQGEDGVIRYDSLGPAYNRATFLDQRKVVVQQWADYLDQLLTQQPAQLVEQPVPAEPLLLAA
jgi:integrase